MPDLRCQRLAKVVGELPGDPAFPQRSFLCSGWREHVLVYQGVSKVNAMGQIDFQDGNCRTPYRSTPFENRAVPSEMLAPLVAARMEKTYDAFCERITSCDVRSFVVVAREAS